MTGKARKTRSDSKMYQLPKDVPNQVNCLLLDENMRYSDNQHWLKEEPGLEVSLSSISNYAILKINAFAKNRIMARACLKIK